MAASHVIGTPLGAAKKVPRLHSPVADAEAGMTVQGAFVDPFALTFNDEDDPDVEFTGQSSAPSTSARRAPAAEVVTLAAIRGVMKEEISPVTLSVSALEQKFADLSRRLVPSLMLQEQVSTKRRNQWPVG